MGTAEVQWFTDLFQHSFYMWERADLVGISVITGETQPIVCGCRFDSMWIVSLYTTPRSPREQHGEGVESEVKVGGLPSRLY